MLALHEVLFDMPHGRERDELLLEKIRDDFYVNRAELLRFDVPEPGAPPRLCAAAGRLDSAPGERAFDGPGAAILFDLQRGNAGALTLTRFRRPSQFETETWTRLWDVELGPAMTALLSVELVVERTPKSFIWLLLENDSREWGSHDRQLAEEAARLLGRAADRALG